MFEKYFEFQEREEEGQTQAVMQAPTPPGFHIESGDLYVMFVSGHDIVFGWTQAEYVIGWKRVMQIILCVFEDHKRMDDIQMTLHKLLEAWAKENWMGRGKEIIFDLKITDEDFLPFDIKQVKIQFYDDLATLLRFYVKKRKPKGELSLKQLALCELSKLIDKPKDVVTVGLPSPLSKELELADIWGERHRLQGDY